MSGNPTLWGEEKDREGAGAGRAPSPHLAQTAALLFVDEGSATTNVALFAAEGDVVELAGGLSLPRGGSPEAAADVLRSLAREEIASRLKRAVLEVHRGGGADLARAAHRIAIALQLPVALVDIGVQAGRYVAASPHGIDFACTVSEAAIAPRDAAERRRRADVAIASIHGANRATVADQLGDLADTPLRDRGPQSDQVRSAAIAGAIVRLAEEVAAVPAAASTDTNPATAAILGRPLIVTGAAARLLENGAIPLSTLAPLLPLGRSRILLEPLGVLSVLGAASLSDAPIASLLRSGAEELLIPGGDLLILTDDLRDGAGIVNVTAPMVRASLRRGESLRLPLGAGASASVELSRGDARGEARLFGGVAGAEIVVGAYAPPISPLAHDARGTKVRPISAPIELLPPASGGGDFITARRLLGDPVSGRVVALDNEPDSAGWEAAREAGILAIANASPETVLRARAVGVRGLIVGSLSDGEIDAIGGSLDRRIAAAVATLPFGLLILAARRAIGDGAERAIRHLDGAEVLLSAEPPGLVAKGRVVRDVSDAARDADVVIVGGEHAGRRGHWRGIADPRSADPLAAIEVDGALVALPFGELQRLRA